jgi:hypothetical protein
MTPELSVVIPEEPELRVRPVLSAPPRAEELRRDEIGVIVESLAGAWNQPAAGVLSIAERREA